MQEAAPSIEQFVISYRASYEAKLTAEQEGTRRIMVYEGSKKVKSDTDFTYKRIARAGYVKVKEKSVRKTVLAGIGILILIFLVIGMLYLFAKKHGKKERKNRHE